MPLPKEIRKMRGASPDLTFVPIGAGEREEPEWQEPDRNSDYDDSPPPSPSRDFAPRGLPKVRKRFRDRLSNPLRIDVPNLPSHINLDEIQGHAIPLFELLRSLLEAVTSSIDRARSTGFLERLRLAIVQSQLLDHPLILGLQPVAEAPIPQPINEFSFHGLTTSGAIAAAVFGFGAAFLIRWFCFGGTVLTWRRIITSIVLVSGMLLAVRGFLRREFLRNIQKQGLIAASTFFPLSVEFDRVNSAALNFIMEVEVVARGYRL
jgi:hypothetical protein